MLVTVAGLLAATILFQKFRRWLKMPPGLNAPQKVWHDNRSFLVKSLKYFGVGRSSMESVVAHEVLSLLESYREKNLGKPMEIDGRLDVAVMNVVWKISTNRQTSLDDEKAQKMIDLLRKFGDYVNQLGPAQFFPILFKLVPKYRRIMDQVRAEAPEVSREFQREVEEHKRLFKEAASEVPQDLVDDYLNERKKRENVNPENAESFADEHLIAVITALFAAGTDTTATTLRYAFIYLAKHQDVQKKCQEQLDSVGAWIVSNINACHRDPKYWPNPEKFDPTRFLDESGESLKKHIPSFLPFGAGKRRCLGEHLAYMELFLHIAYLLSMFNVNFPDGFEPDIKINHGDPITRRPAPFRGAWIVSNINACHRDPKYWPNPEKFDPTRFLDESGESLKKHIPSFLPFGADRIEARMALTGLLLASVLVLFLTFSLRLLWRWQRMPPGPWGVPLIGYIPWVNPIFPWETYTTLSRKYGPVMSVNFCGTPQIILSDCEAVSEALSMMAFIDRPHFLLFEVLSVTGKGFVGNSKIWHENRTFVLKSLKSFGVGRVSLETLVANEVVSLIDSYKANNLGKPMAIDGRLDVAVLNIVWKLATNKQTSLTDEKAIRMIQKRRKFGDYVNQLGPAQFLPSLITFVPKFRHLMKAAKDLSPELTDEFKLALKEKERTEVLGASDEHLSAVITALFAAGTETVATTLRYSFILLAQYRDVQNKCQEQLDEVVGRDRLPSWEHDKPRLPYLEATVREIQRFADIVPLGVPHLASADTEFRGYLIPKGSWIVPNLNAVHRDPKQWTNPEAFEPKRFLDSGVLIKKPNPSFLPFGTGKRRCVGEQLAYMELFIFISYLLANFNIEFPEGFVPSMKADHGDPIARRPGPFEIILTER
ncbi:unnamed protein product [Notodromas monacha]|uniref:Cytochrome P450 n=1 Tax=Notodromas monacha TaxID=399045 RepID=A0A7R9GFA5_9CRUS|nr:unnamed protein product [Notodromas monacha]CAG0919147.1 unnamed protein product [Notodromas monacha]